MLKTKLVNQTQKAELNKLKTTHHYWEDYGQEGGFKDPEDSQTNNLNKCEKMNASQGNVTKEGKVWLVFWWHQIQLDTFPELKQRDVEHVAK